MENQHRQINGYRELSQGEIDLINEIKAKGAEIGDLVERVNALQKSDLRWTAAAKMDLQKGIMCLIRACARPDGF